MPPSLLEDLAHWPHLPTAAVVGVLTLLAALRWFGMSLTLPLVAQLLTLRVRLAFALVLGVAALPLLQRSDAAALAVLGVPEAGASAESWLAACGIRLLCAALIEVGIGAALGLGARVVLCGVQAAGELIDQQAGLAFAQVFHPAAGDDGTPLGALFGLAGAAAFLLLAPCGGDLALAAAAFDLFEALPVGTVLAPQSVADLVVVLVQQSLLLALHVAAPVLAVMSLVTVATGWLGRSAPALSAGPVLVPVRVVTCLVILMVSISGAADVLAERFEVLLERAPSLVLRHAPLGGWPGLVAEEEGGRSTHRVNAELNALQDRQSPGSRAPGLPHRRRHVAIDDRPARGGGASSSDAQPRPRLHTLTS